MALAALASCKGEYNYDAQGTFEATEITISSETNGKITAFDINEGDTLKMGDRIATIDSAQLYLQKMQLLRQNASVLKSRPDVSKQVAALKTQLNNAVREKSRLENLLKDGAATKKQLDDAAAAIEVLRNQLEATQLNLKNNVSSLDENASMIELQIAQADDLLKKCSIVSPIDATVLAKYAEAGEITAAGRPLLKIADMNRLFLRAYFTSEQLADIKLGQEVNVNADFGGDKQIPYKGKIVWISSESEFTPKTIQTKESRSNLVYAVKVAVENDGRLKIGLSGEVTL